MIKGLGRARGENAWSLRMKQLHEQCECNNDINEMPIKPQKVMYELGKALNEHAYITTEVGRTRCGRRTS